MSDYDLYEGWDEVEESHGLESGALPAGWYHFKVEEVSGKGIAQSGSAWLKLRLSVVDGPMAKRNAFVMLTVDAAKTEKVNGVEKKKSDADIANALRSIKGQMRGWLNSIGVDLGRPERHLEGIDKIAAFYNTEAWAGREFVGNIKVTPARPDGKGGMYDPGNRLQQYFHLEDKKKGLAFVQQQQEKAAAAAPASSGSAVRL